MRRPLHIDRRAAVALEFAILAPALLGLFMAAVILCLALWTLIVLQSSAQAAARCAAIGATTCATVTPGCDSASQVVCYAEQVAATRGVSSVTASEVTVSTSTVGGVSFNIVEIAHAFSLLGVQLTLNASGMFPANSTSWGTAPPSS